MPFEPGQAVRSVDNPLPRLHQNPVAARRGGGVERIVAMIRSIPEDVLVAEKLLAALLLTAQSSSSQLLFHRLLLT